MVHQSKSGIFAKVCKAGCILGSRFFCVICAMQELKIICGAKNQAAKPIEMKKIPGRSSRRWTNGNALRSPSFIGQLFDGR